MEHEAEATRIHLNEIGRQGMAWRDDVRAQRQRERQPDSRSVAEEILPSLKDMIREALGEHQKGSRAQIEEQYAVLGDRLSTFEGTISAAADVSAKKVDRLREALEARMEGLEAKMVERDRRIEQVETRVGEQERMSAELERRLRQLENPARKEEEKRSKQQEMEEAVASMVAREVRAFKDKIEELEDRLRGSEKGSSDRIESERERKGRREVVIDLVSGSGMESGGMEKARPNIRGPKVRNSGHGGGDEDDGDDDDDDDDGDDDEDGGHEGEGNDRGSGEEGEHGERNDGGEHVGKGQGDGLGDEDEKRGMGKKQGRKQLMATETPDTKLVWETNMTVKDTGYYMHRGRTKRMTTAYDQLRDEEGEEWTGDLPKLTMEDNKRVKCYLLWCQKVYTQALREGRRVDLMYPPEPYRSVQRRWIEKNFKVRRLSEERGVDLIAARRFQEGAMLGFYSGYVVCLPKPTRASSTGDVLDEVARANPYLMHIQGNMFITPFPPTSQDPMHAGERRGLEETTEHIFCFMNENIQNPEKSKVKPTRETLALTTIAMIKNGNVIDMNYGSKEDSVVYDVVRLGRMRVPEGGVETGGAIVGGGRQRRGDGHCNTNNQDRSVGHEGGDQNAATESHSRVKGEIDGRG